MAHLETMFVSRSSTIITTLILVLFCLLGCTDVRSEPKGQSSELPLVNMDETGLLQKANISDGVIARLVPDVKNPGKSVIEVRVDSVEKHKNPYPMLVFDNKVFARPLNLSGFSRLESEVESGNDSFTRVRVQIASLPYSDGGRNVEESLVTIPARGTNQGSFRLTALERNDPSVIQYIGFLFPPLNKPTIYRIRNVVARTVAAEDSPAARLRGDLVTLRDNFDRIRRERKSLVRTSSVEISQAQKALDDITRQASRVDQPNLTGNLKELRARFDTLNQRVGRLAFADEPGFYLWSVDLYRNFVRTEEPLPESQPVKRLDVSMAQNEYRDAVFMLSAGKKEGKLHLDAVLPKGVSAGALEIFESGYLTIRGSEPTGDAVLPVNGPLIIPQGESRQIRLRFNTRSEAIAAGRHKIVLTIRDANDGLTKAVEVALTVWPFTLPSYDVLPVNSYASFEASEFTNEKSVASAIAEMKRYGLNIVFIHPAEMPRPLGLDANGRISGYDDTLFIKRVRTILDAWRASRGTEKLQFELSVSGMYDLGLKDHGIEFLNPRWKPVLAEWQTHLKAVLADLGLGPDDYFMALGDEAEEAVLVRNEIPMGEALKENDPTLRLTCNTSHIVEDPDMKERFFKLFDIFQPDLVFGIKSNPYLHEWITKNAAAHGKQVWTYQCLGDMAQPGKNVYGYYRVSAWEALKYGFTGLGVWTYCAQAKDQAGISYVMVFNRNDEAVHNRRYEVLREGMDDFRYVWMLRDLSTRRSPKEKAATDKLLEEAIADITEHPEDSTLCEKWRLMIASRILELAADSKTTA